MGRGRDVWFAGICGVALGVGCTDSVAPLGSGSDLKVDVDASLPQRADEADATSADSPFAALDATYGPVPDGYTPLAVCAQCACEGGTFCFGGAPSSPPLSACDQTMSTTLSVGCHVIPPGCAAEPDCVCILRALGSQPSCYQVCTESAQGSFTVYCPP